MATELKKVTSYNIGVIVGNAVTAVKAIRSQENARQESEFQKAVASGMSYDDQVKFRAKQLENVKSGSFPDAEYVAQLETSVATAKKMVRYASIRKKYKDSLDSYTNGQGSIDQYITTLQDSLSTEQDPTLRDELQSALSTAQSTKTTNEMNAIKNRAVVATKDNSVALIESSISEVQSKRAQAAITENDSEVAMWDDTLLTLKGSKSKLQIENGLNEISFQSTKAPLTANDKVRLLDSQITGADASTPVSYNGVQYASLQDYWMKARDQYISTSYFTDLKTQIDNENNVIAATSPYGQVPIARIQAVNDFYTGLTAKPEFVNFANVINQERLNTVTDLATTFQSAVSQQAEAGVITPNTAKQSLATIQTKFGISLPTLEPAGKEKPLSASVTPGTTPPTSPTVAVKDTALTPPSTSIKSPSTMTDAEMVAAGYKFNVNTGASLATPSTPSTTTNPVVPPTTTPTTPNTSVTPPISVTVNNPPSQTPAIPTTNPSTPVGKQYVVQKGDALDLIAKKLGTTSDALATMNGIKDKNKIQVNQVIKY